MHDAFDLDAYFHRIGYSGPRTATLETLTSVHALHPAAIPFENLNPLLGWPVTLDAPSLQAKLVAGARGGWCFEQNFLFRHALEAMGFSVTPLAARVVWNAPPGSPIGPRSHMLLLVDLAGVPYIADVGFGGNVLTTPLRLEPHTVQPTAHEPHRLSPLDNGFVLESCLPSDSAHNAVQRGGEVEAPSDVRSRAGRCALDGEWKPFYRFTLEPQFPSDYEVSNWYLCHHPSSFFRYTLLCARAAPDRRYALRNNSLAIHRNGQTEKRILADAAALRYCLETDFGIRLPESPELSAALERISQSASEYASS